MLKQTRCLHELWITFKQLWGLRQRWWKWPVLTLPQSVSFWKLRQIRGNKESIPKKDMELISIHFLPHFFSFESYIYMKRILHLVPLQNIVFKSSYNWFKYWHSLAALAADCQLLLCKLNIKPKHVLTAREWL